MPILFSAVVFERTILNKYASCDGNFEEILELVLAKIPDKNAKMTYLHGRYLFHYIIENKQFYFCVTDKLCQRSRAFLFLNEIKRRFSTVKTDFTSALAEQMYRYNEDYSTITIRKGEIDELNTIGVDSSESILGEKILIVSNDENLKYSTVSFVEKTPKQVVVSFKPSTERNLNILVISLAIVAICLMFLYNPLSLAIIVVVLIYLINRRTK
ncbi:unnamed protein product, partial [Brenthis ino]